MIEIFYRLESPFIVLPFLFGRYYVSLLFWQFLLVPCIRLLHLSKHIGVHVARSCLLSHKCLNKGVLHCAKVPALLHPPLVQALNPVLHLISQRPQEIHHLPLDMVQHCMHLWCDETLQYLTAVHRRRYKLLVSVCILVSWINCSC